MYLVELDYLGPPEDAARHLPGHLEFLDRCLARGLLLVAGPKAPGSGIGGIGLFREMPEERLRALFSEDPFSQDKAAEYRIIRFNPTKHVPQIAGLLEADGAASSDSNRLP